MLIEILTIAGAIASISSMRGKSSCRRHNIHSRQPPEKQKTKTRKQHECKRLQKYRRHTETNKHLLRERWERCEKKMKNFIDADSSL